MPGPSGPTFAVVVSVARPEEAASLERTVRSAINQTYPAQEIQIGLGVSDEAARKIRDDLQAEGSGGGIFLIPGASEAELAREAVRRTSASHLIFPRAGLRLRACALEEFAAALVSAPDLDAIFSDEDEIADDGSCGAPFLKPGWSPDLLLAMDYVTSALCLRRAAVLEAGIVAEPGLDWRYDLALRTCITGKVGHVALPLVSGPPAVGADRSGQERALRRFLAGPGPEAPEVLCVEDAAFRIRWPVDRGARVSVIVPTRDKADLLERCLAGLKRLTYPNLEIVVVDNGSVEESTRHVLAKMGPTVVRADERFNFSRLINLGAKAATGDYLLILNNDTTSMDSGWLDAMLELAQRPGVGVVGARLLYPWLSPQHEGVVLVRVAGELRGAHLAWHGYRSLDRAVRDVAAVTGACLLTPRRVFEALGGLDETFEVAFGDTDYCLRVKRLGYRVLYTPYAEVIHVEGASRGSFYPTSDQAAFDRRWSDHEDPYHTPTISRLLDVLVHRPDQPLEAGAARPSTTFGLNVAGFLASEKGIGEAARRVCSALRAAEVPLSLDFYDDPASSGGERAAGAGSLRGQAYAVNLVCINPDFLATFLRDRPRYLNGHYNIALWNWELEEIPPGWTRAAAAFDEIWAPSRFVVDPLSRSLTVPVIRVPYPVDPDAIRSAELTRARFGLGESAFLFLSILDFHSVSERKNPLGLIRAFKDAFGVHESAHLLVKTARSRFDRRSYEGICAAARGHNILMIDEVLPRDEVNALYSIADAYVSLHRSEGFGLTLLEAMAAGLPVIATAYGGNTDFMNATNSLLVDYELVELAKDFSPYKRGWRWAEPDVAHAAALMRRLYEDRQEARRLGEAARVSVFAELHPRTVGAMLRERLDVIRDGNRCGAPSSDAGQGGR